MPEFLLGVVGLAYLGLAIFVLSLAYRLVKAVERIADKIEASIK